MFLHDYRLVCELYTVGTLTLTQTERIRRAKIVRTENPGYWLVMTCICTAIGVKPMTF